LGKGKEVNRVLRRILEPESEKVAAEWKRLHNEELHNSYASPDIIRVMKSRMRWAVARSTHGRYKKCIQ
jgi:hypothetical protein